MTSGILTTRIAYKRTILIQAVNYMYWFWAIKFPPAQSLHNLLILKIMYTNLQNSLVIPELCFSQVILGYKQTFTVLWYYTHL